MLLRRLLPLAVVVLMAMPARSAENDWKKPVQVSAGLTTAMCLTREIPHVVTENGIDFDPPVFARYVPEKDVIIVSIYGSRSRSDDAKESLQNGTKIVGEAMKYCGAVTDVSGEARMSKIVVAYFLKQTGKPAKPVILWNNGKFELP